MPERKHTKDLSLAENPDRVATDESGKGGLESSGKVLAENDKSSGRPERKPISARTFVDLNWRVEFQTQKGILYWLQRRTLPDGKRINKWQGRVDHPKRGFTDLKRLRKYKSNRKKIARKKQNG